MREAERRRDVNKGSVVALCVTVLMTLLFLCTLLVFIFSFLPVSRIEMVGVTQYDTSELVTRSGITLGKDKLYAVDTDEIEKILMEGCYYIEAINVRRKLPNKLVFEVTEKTASFYIGVSGSYYALDTSLTVIEERGSNEKFVNMRLPELILPNIRSAVCGTLPEFGESEDEIREALEVVAAVNASMLKSRITCVDISSRFDVRVTVDGKYEAELVNTKNLAEKLDALEEVVKQCDAHKYPKAEIYLGDAATPNVRAIYE